MSHTPGPWKTRGQHVLGIANVQVAWCGANMSCSRTESHGITEDEAKANASLIAAAPDLLSALTMLYEETADYIRINHLGDVHHNTSMQAARAAISKATGEQK